MQQPGDYITARAFALLFHCAWGHVAIRGSAALPVASLRHLHDLFTGQPLQARSVAMAPAVQQAYLVCAASGLIAVQSRTLAPSLPAVGWLMSTPRMQLAQLRRNWDDDQPAAWEAWSALRMPGHALTRPGFSGSAFVIAARRRARSALRRPVQAAAAPPASALDQLSSALTSLFVAFAWEDAARAVGPVLHLWRGAHGAWGVRWSGGPPGDLAQSLFALGSWFELQRHGSEWIFVLDASRTMRAFASHAARASLLAALHEIGISLPAALDAQLITLERSALACRLSEAVLLETRRAEDMAALLAQRGLRACVSRTLSPRAVVIRPDHVARLRRRFAWRDLPDPAPPHNPPERTRAGLRKDDLAWLYAAALACQRDATPTRAPFRLPDALLARVAAALPRSARQLAMHSVDAWQAAASAHTGRSIALIDELASNPPPLAQQRTLHLIERAIGRGGSLRLRYYTASRDEVSARVIDPLRLEARGGQHYLVAYCHAALAERLFRIDRIQAVSPVRNALKAGPARPLPAR